MNCRCCDEWNRLSFATHVAAIQTMNRADRDIEHHQAIAHEYERVVNQPRALGNKALFASAQPYLPAARERMLDLGCGTGQMVERFGVAFQTVIGVDHSPAMLQVAKNKAAMGRVQFVCSDIFQYLAADQQQYDLITAVGFLHHLSHEDIQRVLQAVRSKLTKGGRAVFAEPLEFDPALEPKALSRWNAPFRASFAGYQVDAVDPDEAPIPKAMLEQWIADAGLRIVYQRRGWEIFPRFGGNWIDRLSIPILDHFCRAEGVVGMFVCSARD